MSQSSVALANNDGWRGRYRRRQSAAVFASDGPVKARQDKNTTIRRCEDDRDGSFGAVMVVRGGVRIRLCGAKSVWRDLVGWRLAGPRNNDSYSSRLVLASPALSLARHPEPLWPTRAALSNSAGTVRPGAGPLKCRPSSDRMGLTNPWELLTSVADQSPLFSLGLLPCEKRLEVLLQMSGDNSQIRVVLFLSLPGPGKRNHERHLRWLSRFYARITDRDDLLGNCNGSVLRKAC